MKHSMEKCEVYKRTPPQISFETASLVHYASMVTYIHTEYKSYPKFPLIKLYCFLNEIYFIAFNQNPIEINVSP